MTAPEPCKLTLSSLLSGQGHHEPWEGLDVQRYSTRLPSSLAAAPGLRGVVNLGQTCFMNSILQALPCHAQAFVHVDGTGRFQSAMFVELLMPFPCDTTAGKEVAGAAHVVWHVTMTWSP